MNLRADGQRNRERIVNTAMKLVAEHGAQVSLEEIARQAGVGSATLHRHFASRQQLLEAVFRDGVAALCAKATAKPGHAPGEELVEWLEELTVYSATHRGLAMALLTGPHALDPKDMCCTDLALEALQTLVKRATTAGGLNARAKPRDLLALSNAIAAANENDAATARRVLRLALTGIRP